MIEPVPPAARPLRADAPKAAVRTLAADVELDSGRLFGRTRRLVINHQGERYCLQVTKAGKLLLTK